MIKFIKAEKYIVENSELAGLGKKLIIIGRSFLALTGVIFVILIIYSPFAPSGSMSGVPLVIGLIIWFFFELIGSYFFQFNKLSEENKPQINGRRILKNPILMEDYISKNNITEEKVNRLIGKGLLKAYSKKGLTYVENIDPKEL